jgi:hypothetical protein
MTLNNTMGGGPIDHMIKTSKNNKGGQQRNSSHCHTDTVRHSEAACGVGLTASTNHDDDEQNFQSTPGFFPEGVSRPHPNVPQYQL